MINIKDIESQFNDNSNSFGESQAWIYLNNTERSIEITHEKEGLSPAEEFYSLILHCNEKEFDDGEFYKTNGIIERFLTHTISDAELKNGIQWLLSANQKVKRG